VELSLIAPANLEGAWMNSYSFLLSAHIRGIPTYTWAAEDFGRFKWDYATFPA
jgi:hypothetical protein